MAESERPLPQYADLLDGAYGSADRIVCALPFPSSRIRAGSACGGGAGKARMPGCTIPVSCAWRGGLRDGVKARAKSAGVPILYSKARERNEDLAERYHPADPSFESS